MIPTEAFPGASAEDMRLVTPGSSALGSRPTKGLFVSVAGDINVTMASGREVDSIAVAIGYHPLRVTHVRSGTTATVYALY